MKRALAYPLSVACLIATALFVVFKHGATYPLFADDYRFTAFAARDALTLQSMSYHLAQRPISGLVSYLLYASRWPEFHQAQFVIFFAIHCAGLLLLIDYLLHAWKPIAWNWPRVALVAVICLYPSLYEVLFTNLTLGWSIGTLFMALALRTRNLAGRAVWAFCSIACLESYVVPLFLFPLLRWLFALCREPRTPIPWPEFRKHAIAFVAGIAAFVLVRLPLAALRSTHPYDISLNFAHLLEQFRNDLGFMWTIHFYKVFWVETILQWIAFGVIATAFWRREALRKRAMIGALLLPIVSFLPMLIVAYYAPRSIHASVIMNLALFAAMGVAVLPALPRSLQMLALSSLFIAYGLELVIISNIKQHNALVLEQQARRTLCIEQACPAEGCKMDLSYLADGFRSDWMMPELVRPDFANWVLVDHHLEKNISFSDAHAADDLEASARQAKCLNETRID